MDAVVNCGNGMDDNEPDPQVIHQHYIHSIDSSLYIRQLPSQGLSFQIWPAASALVSLFDRHRLDPTVSPVSTLLERVVSNHLPLRILELGSGTGIVGISAAATLSANVTLTDLPSVIANLRFNVDANSEIVAARGGSAQATMLRWGEEEDIEEIGRDFDILLASDVVYHENLFDPLLETLRFLLGAETKPVLLLAHLRRWKKDSRFFKKAKRMFDVRRLHAEPPLTDHRLGVVVYQFATRFSAHNL